MKEEISDKDLLTRFRSESTRNLAFSLLIEKYQKRLYWHIRRLVIDHDDADDVIQEVFIKVWKNLDNFREDSLLYTWLYRIATNESITFLNRQKMRASENFEDHAGYLVDKLTDSIYVDGNHIQMKLQRAILTLPEKQRIVFNIKYFDEMKYEDMSEILGTSVGALKASYHHAVKKIEEYFKQNE
ncbi:RNA polymerase sigma factor [Solitalea lacus]|uniref:RNA polymerase sigma factor n=1 Tax=Solitalea lacus TaxID=2911172 RepID=UPI001EDC8BDC|nr:RNA polymerase sigma factor [Solitalea lacus]UKJ08840.1 RNA polymerase sigma factor [Solitalea lacus]